MHCDVSLLSKFRTGLLKFYLALFSKATVAVFSQPRLFIPLKVKKGCPQGVSMSERVLRLNLTSYFIQRARMMCVTLREVLRNPWYEI